MDQLDPYSPAYEEHRDGRLGDPGDRCDERSRPDVEAPRDERGQVELHWDRDDRIAGCNSDESPAESDDERTDATCPATCTAEATTAPDPCRSTSRIHGGQVASGRSRQAGRTRLSR